MSNGNWFNNLIYSTGSKLSMYSTVIFSLLFSIIIVSVATRKFTAMSGSVILIITGLIYLLLSSAKGSGLNISVPSVGYPLPPRLGLGAVSLENRFPNPVGYKV